MNLESIIYNIATAAIPILFAITLHEVAHGWVANKLGDGTARMLGRLTVNPIKHIDPIGTIAVPLLAVISAGIMFGWAKPVPVSTRNLKNLRKDMALIAIAGPVSNLLMAAFWVIIMKIALPMADSGIGRGFAGMAEIGIYFNLILFFFNLLPIPPLDGSKVLSGFVPRNIANIMDSIEPYGLYIIVGIIFLSYNGIINISPFFKFIESIALSLVSL